LADAYKQTEDVIARQHRIFTAGEDVRLKETKAHTIFVPAGTLRASFAISYRDPGAAVDFVVRAPDGSTVPTTGLVTGPSSRVLAVPAAQPGTYQVLVTPLQAATGC
jgi:hypothetical protein